MAEGLVRMLRDCGAEARLHYDGLAHLMRWQHIDTSSFRRAASSVARLSGNRREFARFRERLQDTDLIIVVANAPGAFSPSLFPNIELLRRKLPHVPIVNYDLHYLPTLDSWSRYILRGERTNLSPEAVSVFAQGKFGMERYDWYLATTVGTYVPMPPGPQPYTIVGIDIDNGELYPDQQGEVRVLLDFSSSTGRYPGYRRVQVEALKMSGLKYQVLTGRYTQSDIRAIYRKTSIFLLGRSEAFGLPIAELQACGSLIFTPDPYWPCAHWLGDDYAETREPRLSPNFVVYGNDPAALSKALKAAAEAADPGKVRGTFLEQQPQLFRGDRSALAGFLADVASGRIHPELHHDHYPIGRPARSISGGSPWRTMPSIW